MTPRSPVAPVCVRCGHALVPVQGATRVPGHVDAVAKPRWRKRRLCDACGEPWVTAARSALLNERADRVRRAISADGFLCALDDLRACVEQELHRELDLDLRVNVDRVRGLVARVLAAGNDRRERA